MFCNQIKANVHFAKFGKHIAVTLLALNTFVIVVAMLTDSKVNLFLGNFKKSRCFRNEIV